MNEEAKAKLTKECKVIAVNAAKRLVADTEADTFGQVESAKTIIRMLIAEGYIDAPGVFEAKAGSKEAEAMQAAKLRLFYLLHPLTNSAAMNRTLKDDGILKDKNASDLGF